MSSPDLLGVRRHWWHELNRYHWFVLAVACLGWLFDCFDQQIFTLAKTPAMKDLLGAGATKDDVASAATNATAIFLIGWGAGGLFFGILGDRIGRAKTMVITILLYSIFTGLSALSQGFWDFALYRFLTGLGVGGEFAVGVALIAEVMPERARAYSLGLLQVISALGNIAAAGVSVAAGKLEESHAVADTWRWMFVVGAVPALLALIIRIKLKEPERWQKAKEEGRLHNNPLANYAAILGDPLLRRHAIIGMLLACVGVIGLWGIGFFSVDLQRLVFEKHFIAEGLDDTGVEAQKKHWAGIVSLMMNLGAAAGMFAYSHVCQKIGRRPAFAIAMVAAFFATGAVFLYLDEFHQVFWMVPLMGFFQLALFAGYAIYFPELFPTHLRSTGVSLCYNVGRFVAAFGPAIFGLLTKFVFSEERGYHEGMRYAGLSMCGVFLLGLIVVKFAPETKDKPLME